MEIILIVYLVVSIALIGVILLQQGKGAEMGASFGAGGANTVFGASGSGNVLTKTTTILAILFFATALAISYMNSAESVQQDDVLDVVVPQEASKEKALESEVAEPSTGLESEVAPAAKMEAEKADAKVEAAKAEAAKLESEEKEETKEKKKDDTEN